MGFLALFCTKLLAMRRITKKSISISITEVVLGEGVPCPGQVLYEFAGTEERQV